MKRESCPVFCKKSDCDNSNKQCESIDNTNNCSIYSTCTIRNRKSCGLYNN